MALMHIDPGVANNAAYPVSDSVYANSPHLATEAFMRPLEEDFHGPLITSGAIYGPWVVANIGTPTYAVGTATADHPGVMQVTSQASANTGATILMPVTQIIPAGGEMSEFVFQVGITTGAIDFLGFFIANSYTQPTTGAWINIAGTTLSGVCGGGSITSTGSTYTITQATWYRATITNNTANTLWTFRLYTCSNKTLVWTDTVSSNLPAALLSHGIVTANSGGSAVLCGVLDYMNVQVNRALSR